MKNLTQLLSTKLAITSFMLMIWGCCTPCSGQEFDLSTITSKFNGGLVKPNTENTHAQEWQRVFTEDEQKPYVHPDIEKDGYADKFYVMVFKATWCKYCKNLTPMIEEAREKGIKVYVFDADKNNYTFKKLNIQTLPTVIMMKDGEEKARFKGAKSRQTYLRKIRQLRPKPEPQPDEPEPQPDRPPFEPEPEVDYSF